MKKFKRVLAFLLCAAISISVISCKKATEFAEISLKNAGEENSVEIKYEKLNLITNSQSASASVEESTESAALILPGEDPGAIATSPYLLMINAGTGERICEREAYTEVAPASLTKVMTAVIALENIPDLKEEYTFTSDVIQYLANEHSSVAGFSCGETVTAEDLLYAAMLPSGGDGAIGLAILAAGSVDAFVELMNQKVSEPGLEHTHFENPTGLDADNHYSCANDICEIMKYAVGNEAFVQVISASAYTTSKTPYHPNGLTLRCLMSEGVNDNSVQSDYLIGGKPDFTDAARVCLVTYAQHNGEYYILATLGAGNGQKTPQYQFIDMGAVYSHYFNRL